MRAESIRPLGARSGPSGVARNQTFSDGIKPWPYGSSPSCRLFPAAVPCVQIKLPEGRKPGEWRRGAGDGRHRAATAGIDLAV